MADYRDSADLHAVNLASSFVTLGPDWETEDAYWQSAYPERPYAKADRGYEYYRSAYRYGAERAIEWRDREWSESERHLRDGWVTDAPLWDDVRDAVRDAWDHVRGRSNDDRTHI